MVLSESNTSCATEEILDKALREAPLSRREVLHLLGLEEAGETDRLFAAARSLRRRYFGDSVFLYGFLYLSTWCRNNCSFCGYRASNELGRRYRKTDRQAIQAAADLAGSGVHLLDLTIGEDPLLYETADGFDPLLHLIKEVKRQTSLPIMISFGALPDDVLDRLGDAGADWYACYQETHNEGLFRELRPNQNYGERLRKKYRAAASGLLIEEGILSGVGESLDDAADSMEEMRRMNAHQVRVMNFVPQRGTPMQDLTPPAELRELVIMAVLRLLFSDRLIPASLDVYGIAGLKSKLEAGANVVTSLVLPESDMVGVAQSTLGIGEGHRTVNAVLPILSEMGLTRAAPRDYVSWMRSRKEKRPS
jgi:methylornithine synthase